MDPIIEISLLFIIGVAGTLADARGRAPTTARRHHLLETEAGDRARPFGGTADGSADGATACRGCGRCLEAEPYRYCTVCLSQRPPRVSDAA
jgi:hypothetical protein